MIDRYRHAPACRSRECSLPLPHDGKPHVPYGPEFCNCGATAQQSAFEAAERELAAERAKVAALDAWKADYDAECRKAVAADMAELAAERAKVADLQLELVRQESLAHGYTDEIAQLRATLAKVEAFFAEHGERLTDRVECSAGAPADPDCADCTLQDALAAILATLPKGTTES
jgi:hypothetical protein